MEEITNIVAMDIILPNSKLVINPALALGLNPDRFANGEFRIKPDFMINENSYGN